MPIFVSSLGLLFSVEFSVKFYFLVHVNQSLSCIRSCHTDLVSIVFPVIFPRFLSHLLYFKLSFLEGFRYALINSIFSLFAVIVPVNRQVKVEFKLYESVFYTRVSPVSPLLRLCLNNRSEGQPRVLKMTFRFGCLSEILGKSNMGS